MTAVRQRQQAVFPHVLSNTDRHRCHGAHGNRSKTNSACLTKLVGDVVCLVLFTQVTNLTAPSDMRDLGLPPLACLMSLDQMVLAGFPYAVVSDTLCEAVVFPARGLSRVSLTSLRFFRFRHAELIDVTFIILDDLFFSIFAWLTEGRPPGQRTSLIGRGPAATTPIFSDFRAIQASCTSLNLYHE